MSPKFSLIVCTYMRPVPLKMLLKSVMQQSLYPDEILIIDGSTNDDNEVMLKNLDCNNLKFIKVAEQDRGLTKQRNIGLQNIHESVDIVCFLDDDTVLTENYFEALISTYNTFPDALAVGGYILNEAEWKKTEKNIKTQGKFIYDGWSREEPLRFKIRKWFGLLPDALPGYLPTFSHGRSIGFLPPTGKVYPVEQIMGGVSSYKKKVFSKIKFSEYFEGYGLYEDTDFSLRLATLGKLYINTAAQLYHYHDHAGRPNKFVYGKMVVRNGWYVWRIKYSNPSFKARVKWSLTSLLLASIRFLNIFNTNNRIEALTESAGRVFGLVSLIFDKPKISR